MPPSGRGGKRQGAGRKKGSGIFKEPTIVKRIPQSALPAVDYFLNQLKHLVPSSELPEHSVLLKRGLQSQAIPIASDPVRAGFLTTAQASIDDYVDFNELLVEKSDQTIGIYAEGNSMNDAGISDGDLLIVKTNFYPKDKDIVVAQINQDFTVKRIHFSKTGLELHPENSLEEYPIIRPLENDEMKFIGIVTYIIKKIS